jgi:hypothetical protein
MVTGIFMNPVGILLIAMPLGGSQNTKARPEVRAQARG